MGLGESKIPFEAHESQSTPQKKKEIGICPMWDPRSPSDDFERTPVLDRNESVKQRDIAIGVVPEDPRSPSNEITRTPVGAEFEKSSTELEIDNELRLQLEKLQIYDGHGLHYTSDSTENLGNDSESISAVTQQKTVLKLLDEEPATAPAAIDSLWSPNTPPCPKSRSTPREESPNSPETPDCHKAETEGLIKRRKAAGSSRKQRGSQKTEKLQKKVLKKAFTEQATRSPLAERNGVIVKEAKPKAASGKAKSAAFVKYRKYNNLDESFGSDSFVGKENEQFVW